MVRMRIPVSSRPCPPRPRPALKPRLRLLVVGAAVATLAAIVPASSDSAIPAEEQLAAPSQGPGLRTLVIDPGHGGQAVGATGPGGLTEKEVTLDIARRLKQVVERRLGLQVRLTRDSDVDVPHETRTETANYWQADLFMSIHANSYRMGSIRGPETYFLSDTASDALAMAAAESENPPPAAEGEATQAPRDPALDFILWDLAQTQHLRESSMLAEIIQSNLSALWGVSDRGVKQAPFIVLKGATMPAVLVEVGYLSNSEDAQRLADSAYRQQIAETLYRSITEFRQRYAVLVGAAPDP